MQDDMCVVCQSEPRDCFLMPCRHCCLCYECALNLTTTGSVQLDYGQIVTGGDPKCPMCRVDIESVVRTKKTGKSKSEKSSHKRKKSCQKESKSGDGEPEPDPQSKPKPVGELPCESRSRPVSLLSRGHLSSSQSHLLASVSATHIRLFVTGAPRRRW